MCHEGQDLHTGFMPQILSNLAHSIAKKEQIVKLYRPFTGRIAAVLIVACAAAFSIMGQKAQAGRSGVAAKDTPPPPTAKGNNLYCAGFIQVSPMATGNMIVGSDDEADKYTFAAHDLMYINMGSNKGVNVGDVFAVVRPRGQFRSRWTTKGDLGFYVQELGALEVVRVKQDVSVARIKSSCDNFLLGDIVQPIEKRTSPVVDTRGNLDVFSDPSGKARGRVVLARDGAEMISRDFIAYVDLGSDDNVRVGDTLTVFRPLGKGNLFQYPQVEDVGTRDYGYHSDVYSGGKYSNQAARKAGDTATGNTVTTRRAKQGRPELRKVVGEAVVLNVKERTATVVITRVAQEIHTGDWVEIK